MFRIYFVILMGWSSVAAWAQTVPISGTTPTDTVIIADSSRALSIREVTIEGNRKTRKKIITRELSVAPGDQLSLIRLNDTLKLDRNKIYNTNLFNEVEPQIQVVNDSTVDLNIKVDERWYLYPVPIFRLADRNFNDWWVNQGANFQRVNYGLRVTQYNFRGRGERLRFMLQSGFEDRFIFNYLIPYIDKKQRIGIMPEFIWLDNNNTFFETREHIRQFRDSDEVQRQLRNASVTFSYRKAFYNFHFFSIGGQTTTVTDTIAALNPDYFGDQATNQKFLSLNYTYLTDRRDNRNYPLHGSTFTATVDKDGIGVFDDLDTWTFFIRGTKYVDLNNDFYFGTSLSGMITSPNAPYFNYYGLGFDQNIYVRGFETEIIEGQRFVLSKNSARKKIFSNKWDISRFMPVRQFQTFPLALYGKLFFDAAYIRNYPNNQVNSLLTDKLIYGAGFGLDIVTVYDFVIRLEYSYTSDGQTQFFLNFRADL